MSILLGPMLQHLNGHKELTDHNPIIEIKDSALIYIPLINGMSTNIEVLVKEGDKVKVGTKVAYRNDNMIVPLFSSVSGTVKGKETFMHSILKPVEHLVIENDFKYEKETSLKPLDYTKASREELVDFTMNSGIVGCGGAGFPTYIKYKFAKDVHTILINGVECEPYITADYREMKENLEPMILGVQAMVKMADAKKAMIAIKETKKEFIATVREALKSVDNVEVVEVPDVYPMGWERTVVYQVFKKRYDKLPGEIGVVVNNATTAIQLGKALSTGMPIVEKIVTVSGDGVKEPANVRVPVGTRVAEIIAKVGGYTAEDILLIGGGPMMGKTIVNDLFVITPYSNAITVFKNPNVKEIACLRCGKCSDYCPAALQPVRINQFEKSKNADALDKLAVNECIECGMCSYVCPSRIDVTEGIRRAKRFLATRKK